MGRVYVHIGIENCIKNVLQHNNYSYDTISLNINIDGLPSFKSTALDLWPILIYFVKLLPMGVAFYFGKKATS